jgi:hypothetical protein
VRAWSVLFIDELRVCGMEVYDVEDKAVYGQVFAAATPGPTTPKDADVLLLHRLRAQKRTKRQTRNNKGKERIRFKQHAPAPFA